MTGLLERHPQPEVSHSRLRGFLLSAALATYLAIVLGGILRAGQPNVILDTLHRLFAVLPLPPLLAAAYIARRRLPGERWITSPIYAALGLLIVQTALGGLLALRGSPAGLTALHLAISLLIQGLVLVPTVLVFHPSGSGSQPLRLAFRSPFARLSLLSLATTFLLLATGALVAGSGATQACPAWPLCSAGVFPQDVPGWINLAHRLVVVLAGAALLVLLLRAWRSQRTQTTVLVTTTAAVVLLFCQSLLAGLKVRLGFPAHLLALHEATAVAVWAILVVQAVAVGMAARSSADERLEAGAIQGRTGLLRDFLMLTKPVVVLLLLVTTVAGMVIGARQLPPLGLVWWTLLGGALAAGGSGAINQYIDRFDDRQMQRTQHRPIPAGRLTPGEGLAFGVAACLVSFYLLVSFVNLLAALLSLAGMVYYVLIYSIFLKKATVQNIVIGGGAGAIPPLVGWAAATGGLNVPSLFLFALVFMWTPPHFWALALVRRQDYARAGVPMLPVVRGEQETRWQIFLYTIELVALTLLLPLFGLGGSLYLLAAAALGGWLLISAWRVWRQGGNKLAWKMYRHSSMYLAFIFLALMVDALL